MARHEDGQTGYAACDHGLRVAAGRVSGCWSGGTGAVWCVPCLLLCECTWEGGGGWLCCVRRMREAVRRGLGGEW